MLRIAAVQHDIVWEDRDANLAALAPLVAKAAEGARLAADRDLRRRLLDGHRPHRRGRGRPDHRVLVDQAAHHASGGGSVPIRARAPTAPATPSSSPARMARCTSTTSGTRSAGEEDEHFEAGDEALTVAIDDVRSSPAVCCDLQFADQFWAQAEAPTCTSSSPTGRARASTTGALLIARPSRTRPTSSASNRVGDDGLGVAHVGGSVVIDPMGQVVAEAGRR